jgi:hypothetical protein
MLEVQKSMSTNIPKARSLIEKAKATYRKNPGPYNRAAEALLEEALTFMTREQDKKVVRRGNVVTDAHRRRITEMDARHELDDMTCAEIAELVFGNASASGRVSEILRGRQ